MRRLSALRVPSEPIVHASVYCRLLLGFAALFAAVAGFGDKVYAVADEHTCKDRHEY